MQSCRANSVSIAILIAKRVVNYSIFNYVWTEDKSPRIPNHFKTKRVLAFNYGHLSVTTYNLFFFGKVLATFSVDNYYIRYVKKVMQQTKTKIVD